MNDEFYVSLISNTTDSKKANTISEFTTYLPHQRNLGNIDYEVSLVSFSYQHSWFHLYDGEAYFSIKKESSEQSKIYHVPPGHYESNETFIDTLNTLLNNSEGNETYFEYKKELNQVFIHLKNHDKLVFNAHLASILGFKHKAYQHIGAEELLGVPENGIDLNIQTHNLFVYSEDLVENSLVGDHYYPLLCIVGTDESNYNRYVTWTNTDRSYIRVINNNLSKIKVSIKDDNNEPIRFMSGRTVLWLHFRKKNTLSHLKSYEQ